MFEARHAAVVAGLGTSYTFALPTVAVAKEGFALTTVFSETPLVVFVVGAVAGFTLVSVVAAITSAAQKRSKAAQGHHFASNVPAVSRAQRKQSTAVLVPVARHMRLGEEAAEPLSGKHTPSARHFAVSAAHAAPLSIEDRVPSPEITDYVNVAQRYVLEDRKAQITGVRSRGVAAVLLERLGARQSGFSAPERRRFRQNNFPTIERGFSQIDENEAWWADLEPVAPNVTAVAEPVVYELTAEDKRRIAQENAAKRKSAERISRAVAQIDQGVYPEQRSVDELDEGEDLWAMALAAMDEHMPAVIFSDSVGTEETIDEPDNLEMPTNFIESRARQRQPEFYDTSAFIDYIVGDELSRSSSSAVRRRSGTYLKVLEGGTQSTARLGRHARASRDEYPVSTSGKHFAQAAEA